MSGEAREIVRRALDAFARRDNEAVVRDYADDIIWDLSGYDGWPGRTTYRSQCQSAQGAIHSRKNCRI